MGRGLWYTGGDLSEKFQGWRTVEGFKFGVGGVFFGDVETLAPSGRELAAEGRLKEPA